MRTSIYVLITDILNLFMGAISFFILARVILKLFAANTATPFVSFIYNVSGASLLR
ncbi:hypothetical protein HY024_04970 [Candidatus Curtissbacteria bacterium]|nr:hypothetical protein [Candidatus Curtissbacteria bacterium]